MLIMVESTGSFIESVVNQTYTAEPSCRVVSSVYRGFCLNTKAFAVSSALLMVLSKVNVPIFKDAASILFLASSMLNQIKSGIGVLLLLRPLPSTRSITEPFCTESPGSTGLP